MTYNEALNFIQNKQSLGIMPGLDRIKKLLDTYDNPQDKIKIIHIAGTNGKGTVAKTIADALMHNGLKAGLFTSPWITDYREQIQINCVPISKESFTEIAENLSLSDCGCSEFELVTAMAYIYFELNKVDYAVMECGMGGLGDATNVEKSNVCSVLTSISLDHTGFLGSTVEEITKEKEGIIRQNSPCFRYESTGNFHADNLNLAKRVIQYLGYNDHIELSRLPARQERLGGILLDGGHNEEAGKALSCFLDNEIAVIGMMKDKDVDGYLSHVAPKCKKMITTTPNHIRSMPAAELAEYCKKYCDDVISVDNPKLAVKSENVSLICGSFYLAREVRNLILQSL